MKDELKTLKDLGAKKGHRCFIDYPEDCICVGMDKLKEELKAEAIKWVKKIKKDIKIWEEELPNLKNKNPFAYYNLNDLPQGFEDQIIWIKMFFNLTEADLK